MMLRASLLAAGAAIAIAAAPLSVSAESINHGRSWGGPGTPYPHASRSYGGSYKPHYRYGYPYRYGHRWDDDDTGAAVAAGIAGLAVGTIIGSAASSQPTYYYRSSPEPWTPAWYRYCESRYRSFDPRTGTYLGYDGQRHFCS